MSQSKSIQDESQAIAWIGQFAQHAGPRYLQIADFVERALADGRLKPGDRLPPQRRLAQLLNVDLTTVTRAYDEARRRNLLEGRGARGTYAAAPKVELAQLLDLSMNIPPPPAGVDFDDLLKQGLAQVLLRTDSGLLMNYHLGGGSQADRAAGAAWLAPMLGRVDEGQVVVCPGAQSALAALILTLSRPGDTILAEPAVYPGLRTAAAQLGRRVVAVEVDAAGMLPDALEKACGKQRVALLYLNPTLQNPTMHTMPAARRREIARVAARCGVQIIEDDPYWLLADAPPPPLAHYAPRQVNYISTLSKCLAPGLRTAFVLLSDPQRREAFMAALRSFVLMSTPLTTALTTQWIHDGSAQRLLAGVKEEARKRQVMAHQLLAGRVEAQAGADGIHVWLPLPAYWTAHELAQAAQAEGLAVTSSEAFYAGPRPPNVIRISLGSIRDSHRLAAALRKLSQLLARKPSSRHQALV
ncbi:MULTISPECIES: PLP-dependent aminotransferase family protein [unclassified Duganella]|uniref:aminotransferase-like domain-containing protein n=1 Tax=unclassified Duganella TaxID=2636909 RepID=UPI0018F2A34C|nr:MULTISPECIES: PLP-dependent aminotransferase family protein [unclassified Duganella]